MNIVGLCGSLRKGSWNRLLLEAAAAYLPISGEFEILDCSALPLYDSDLDGEEKPQQVLLFKEKIETCDGLLIGSPEYNYGIPGGVKNAIDWASRPAYKSVLKGKPAAILSVSKSPVGGARMQMHLRDVLAATLTPVVPAQPFILQGGEGTFAPDGSLADEKIQLLLQCYMTEYYAWTASRPSSNTLCV